MLAGGASWTVSVTVASEDYCRGTVEARYYGRRAN